MDWGNKNDDEMCYSQIAPKHQRAERTRVDGGLLRLLLFLKERRERQVKFIAAQRDL